MKAKISKALTMIFLAIYHVLLTKKELLEQQDAERHPVSSYLVPLYVIFRTLLALSISIRPRRLRTD